MINQIQKKMKKSFTFFLFLVAVLMTSRAYSQELVITEIMYNDPSTGGAGDSLEFVEIYNNTADPYDMTGYQLTTAITFTFPSFTLQPYSYVVVAKNSTLAQTYYGVIGAYQWLTRRCSLQKCGLKSITSTLQWTRTFMGTAHRLWAFIFLRHQKTDLAWCFTTLAPPKCRLTCRSKT